MKYNILEAQINPADAKELFKSASDLRSKGSPLGKVFKGLKKDKIDSNELLKVWVEEGRPDDTRDIKQILKDHGFGDKEINKVFSQVFGDEEDEPIASPAIQKIVNYVKENGLADNLKTFMQKEFGEELGLVKKGALSKTIDIGKKAWKKIVAEDIRKIFTEIVKEERSERIKLIKEKELEQLGRSKKYL